MTKFTQAQFAKLIGKKSNYILSYVSRGLIDVVIERGKKYIYSDNPVNKSFLENFFANIGEPLPPDLKGTDQADTSGSAPQPPAVKNRSEIQHQDKSQGEQQAAINDTGGTGKELTEQEIEKLMSGVLPLNKSKQLISHLTTEKLRKENLKLDIEIQKRSGELMPLQVTEKLFFEHNRNTLYAFKATADKLLIDMSHTGRFTNEQIAEFKGRIITELNKSVNDAKEATTKQLKSIVAEYAETRTQGQRS